MPVVHTGKFFAEDKRKELKELAELAARTPVILLSQRHLGPNGKTEDQLAREAFHNALNAAAMAAGLPKPVEYVDDDGDECIIHYGADFATGEILGWEP